MRTNHFSEVSDHAGQAGRGRASQGGVASSWCVRSSLDVAVARWRPRASRPCSEPGRGPREIGIAVGSRLGWVAAVERVPRRYRIFQRRRSAFRP